MKWTSTAVRFLAALAAANAFAPSSHNGRSIRAIVPPAPCTSLMMSSASTVGAEVDLFYDDEDEDDPGDMTVSEIKRELETLKIDYDDCHQRRQLEMRLRLVRDNPSKYQQLQKPKAKAPHGGRPQDGPTPLPQNNPVGMKSVETSFESLEQNVIGSSKKEQFFGAVGGAINVEGVDNDGPPRPPTWTDDAALQKEQNMASTRGEKKETFFADAIPTLETPKAKPGNDRPRWSQFDGIKVEAPSGKSVHFDSDHYNRKVQVEQANERQAPPKQTTSFLNDHESTSGSTSGTTTFSGEFGHNHIDLETPAPGQSRGGNFGQNHIDLTAPTGQGGANQVKKAYKRASQQDKDRYSRNTNFPYDQQASSTMVYNGIQVEQVPGQKEYRVANDYDRAQQGGKEKDFQYDPQRAEATASLNGIQVECAPGEVPSRTPNNDTPFQSAEPREQSSKTTSFEGVKNSAQEDLYSASSRSVPDDPFRPRTLENPDPQPRRTSHNDVHHNPGPASTGYGGTFEKQVGGGSASGNEDDNSISGNLGVDGLM